MMLSKLKATFWQFGFILLGVAAVLHGIAAIVKKTTLSLSWSLARKHYFIASYWAQIYGGLLLLIGGALIYIGALFLYYQFSGHSNKGKTKQREG